MNGRMKGGIGSGAPPATAARARVEVWDRVMEALHQRASEPVFFTTRGSLDGARVARRLEETARRLHGGGVGPGTVALLAVRPGIEAFVTTLALVRLGATATPMDPGAGPELFRSRVELLRPTAVVAESLFYAAGGRGPLRWAARRGGLELPALGRIPARHFRLGPWLPGCPPGALRLDGGDGGAPSHPGAGGGGGGASGSPAPSRNASARHCALPDAEDLGTAPTMVVFTSGTTGRPKGVQHSASSALATVLAIRDHLHVDGEAVVLNYALHSLLAAVLAGVPTRIAPLRPRPKPWLETVGRDGVTTAFLRPSEALRIVEHCEGTGTTLPASLRTLYLYSAPVTDLFMERLHAVAGAEFRAYTVYGMTEALPVAWAESRERIRRRGEGDWVGHPIPGLELRIGAAGTLEVRGPTVHQGYLGEPPVEWHDTGDLARIEADGSLSLLGRAKDMILRDGLNIYPALYEETIRRIPGVGDCALIGVPDPATADETVVLYVVPERGPAESGPVARNREERAAQDRRRLQREVAQALRSGPTAIDRKALPDAVEVVAALPSTPRGKVDRRALRERARGRPGWIVVPCYNEEARIGVTLDALAAQTASDFTVVLVDNGSTDGTRDAIAAARRRHPHLTLVVLDEPEKGTGCAADTGFRYAIAQGADVVYRTDADCLPEPDWFGELRRFMVEGDYDAAGGRLTVRTDDVGLNWFQLLPSRFVIRVLPAVARLRRSNRGDGYLAPYVLLPGPNVAIRAEAYEAVGGYRRASFDHAFLDKAMANALRRLTPRIGHARRAVVRYSERRTEAYGVLGTLRWLTHRGGHRGVTDVR